MKDNHNTPKIGAMIEITTRHCSDKVCKLSKVGSVFVVREIERSSTSKILIVGHPTRKRDTLRVSDKNFDWKVITEEDLKEQMFKAQCKSDVDKMTETFTFEEQMKISYIPLILNLMAWRYADEVLQYCADHKISLLIKLSRATKMVRKEWFSRLSLDLDRKHIEGVEKETDRFMQEIGNDLTILYFTVNNVFMKCCPNYPYDDMRTKAIISMLFIKLFYSYNKEMDKVIESKLAARNSIKDPLIDSLYSSMDAFAGEIGKFDYDNFNVKNAVTVIRKRLEKIQFNVV